MTLGVRRISAWLIDWACILGWVALTAAIGVPLYLAGVTSPMGVGTLNVISALVVVVPVVVGAAWFESRPRSATPGKRVLGLEVRTDAGRPRFPLALLRNALKIGVPWLIGHAAVFAITTSSADGGSVAVGVWVLVAAAYVIPIVWIVSLFVAGGRTPYDRLSGTTVERHEEPPVQ
ncbi:RDD family protein [Agromyces sp. H66]|uniref:RDD family protein n=1 Tax=Agromyces sp. H66 TaxID=2529859 RepID=UPI0010AB1318|nr:RDD family protein [Agromyces sp. H66]